MGEFNGGLLRHGEALLSVFEITSDWLVEQGACRNQLNKFVEVFGKRARVDSTSFRLAVLNGLDLDWAARRIFAGSTLLAYKLMYRRAEHARDTRIKEAWRTLWDVVTSPVRSDEGCDAARQIYENVRATENARFRAAWMGFFRRHGFH